MDRRIFVKTAWTSIVSTIMGWTQASRANATPQKPGWGYVGEAGPDHWSELSEQYQACDRGKAQSPIDLSTDPPTDLQTVAITDDHPLAFSYQDTPLKLLNTGRTLQVIYAPGSTLSLEDHPFELLQFHFHSPSEHTQNGRHHPMEIHFVHQNPKTKALAVIGVFVEIGQRHPALSKIWQHIPNKQIGEVSIPNRQVNAAHFLPSQSYPLVRYLGSLTTPPCSEGVTWLVMETSIQMSQEQIDHFLKVVGPNARPTQSLNQRPVLEIL